LARISAGTPCCQSPCKRGFPNGRRRFVRGNHGVGNILWGNAGDILFLYTYGVHDGSDAQDRGKLEAVMREHCLLSAKDICNGLLEFAVRKDDYLLQTGEGDQIDDKTVFVIKKD
jgi:hypothetical protein